MYLDISISLKTHDTFTLCSVHNTWYTMSTHHLAVTCSQRKHARTVKILTHILILPFKFEERVRSRRLEKKKKSNPKFSCLPFLSVLLLLLPGSIQLLPSSRKLISTMSCFLVFISCSFPLTCTLLLQHSQNKGKLAARNKRTESIVLHSASGNTPSPKALALISANLHVSFGHRTH